MTNQKQFLDAVTDLEDALQRMAVLNTDDSDLVRAASDAADFLLVLSQVMVTRGSTLAVPDLSKC